MIANIIEIAVAKLNVMHFSYFLLVATKYMKKEESTKVLPCGNPIRRE